MQKSNKHDPIWFKKRNYIHFDREISAASATSYVSEKKNIIKHSFYPFISYDAISFKIKKIQPKQVVDSMGKTREVTIEKERKTRPIAYSAHLDSHIYSFYSHILSEKYEELLENRGICDNILAFRRLKKSNVDFALSAFNCIKDQKNCVAIALDIKGFFKNLDHAILKNAWCSVLGEEKLPPDHFSVYKSITRYAFVDKTELYSALELSVYNTRCIDSRLCNPLEFRNKVRANGLVEINTSLKGIPQGSPISALLSNIYMIDFDTWLNKKIKNLGGKYFRYCDDIMVIAPLEYKTELVDSIKKEIAQLKISINDEKTDIREFYFSNGIQTTQKPLQYLGFTYDGGKILLRSASLARFSEKMKGGVKLAKSTMRKRNAIRKTKGLEERAIFKRKLYTMYSYRGGRNFISYGLKAADKMQSNSIKTQLRPLWRRLQVEIKSE